MLKICSHCSSTDIELFKVITGYNKKDYAYICKNCLSGYDKLEKCAKCKNFYQTSFFDKYSPFSSTRLCYHCFRNEFRVCKECGTLEKRKKGERHRFTCERCKKKMKTCYICKKDYSERSIVQIDNNEFVCRRCIATHHSNELSLYPYNYKPDYLFFKTKKERKRTVDTYGIELEVELDDPCKYEQVVAWLKMKHGETTFLKHDGSLMADHGLEVVTQPFTHDYYREKFRFEMDEIIDGLNKRGLTSYDNGRCGLHIHFSKTMFKKIDDAKLIHFFAKCKRYIKTFSRRTDYSYCRMEVEEKMSQVLRKKALRNGYTLKSFIEECYYNNRDKYCSINFLHDNSIEIRVFRGTLNKDRFYASLKFVKNLVEFIKNRGYTYFHLNSGVKLWNDFLKYNRKECPQLFKYLKNDIKRAKRRKKSKASSEEISERYEVEFPRIQIPYEWTESPQQYRVSLDPVNYEYTITTNEDPTVERENDEPPF